MGQLRLLAPFPSFPAHFTVDGSTFALFSDSIYSTDLFTVLAHISFSFTHRNSPTMYSTLLNLLLVIPRIHSCHTCSVGS
ncbi:hypothetical protein M408DRAFT_211700 [Serendipita vermifera MAFF 305830]|uniref:Uncharacterized protein n=1 Tax=Serendipita vermifera MAFF 305830 TaxID=933852 RepID=A0A0C2WGE8_SERVB|nr:hypothetical protein M408DRAFT_211700 [Serendipita vermifera MAFF 305830]